MQAPRAEEVVTVRITADLTESQAEALAQFLKRAGWQEFRALAADDEEAFEIRAAVEQLRRALAEQDFAPR